MMNKKVMASPVFAKKTGRIIVTPGNRLLNRSYTIDIYSALYPPWCRTESYTGLKKITVKKGQIVKKGHIIGYK